MSEATFDRGLPAQRRAAILEKVAAAGSPDPDVTASVKELIEAIRSRADRDVAASESSLAANTRADKYKDKLRKLRGRRALHVAGALGAGALGGGLLANATRRASSGGVGGATTALGAGAAGLGLGALLGKRSANRD